MPPPTRPSATTALPIAKAARFLGVHPNTLRAWADQGRVRCLRVNARGDRRFPVEDLQDFVLESEQVARRSDLAPADRADDAEADWEAQIDSIAKLGTRLNHLSTVDEIGAAICVELRQLIDYHNVRVYRVHADQVVPVAWRGETSAYTGEDGEQLRLRLGEGITGWVAQNSVAQYLPDAAADARGAHVPGTEEELDESMLVAPMVYESQVIGVIVLSRLGLDRFAAHDLRYLEIYAAIAAQAMANADISERLRAQEETLDRELRSQHELLRVTERILTNLDPAAVIEEIADSLAGLIPVDAMGIYVREPRRRSLEPLLARGVEATALMDHGLPDPSGVAAEVLRRGEARSVTPTGSRPAATIMAPLKGREGVLGVLHLERRGRAARFESREFDLVRLFAAHVSIALQNALTHRAVELRAQTDSLTGLRNLGTFREDLAEQARTGATFALLMLDLDDFKAFNDRWGHEAGNELLGEIAAGIEAACRDSDRVYRYGGDEFCVILPGATLPDASEVGERIRAAVAAAHCGARRRVGISCSVGVAAFPADASDDASLLLAADRALYAAKRAGRDRVATAADGATLAADLLPPHAPVDARGWPKASGGAKTRAAVSSRAGSGERDGMAERAGSPR